MNPNQFQTNQQDKKKSTKKRSAYFWIMMITVVFLVVIVVVYVAFIQKTAMLGPKLCNKLSPIGNVEREKCAITTVLKCLDKSNGNVYFHTNCAGLYNQRYYNSLGMVISDCRVDYSSSEKMLDQSNRCFDFGKKLICDDFDKNLCIK